MVCSPLLPSLPCGTGVARELVLQPLPACGHVADATGLCGGEIVLLAPVVRQVEQLPGVVIFAGGNQFVVTHAQGAVAFVVKEDGVAGDVAILGKRRHQAVAG